VNGLKLRKLTKSIQYNDGKQWINWIEGEETSISQTWQAIQCGYCNDQLIELKRKLRQ